MLPLKKSILGLQSPMISEKEKYNNSLNASGELIGEVKVDQDLSTSDHIQAVKGERRYCKRRSVCRK